MICPWTNSECSCSDHPKCQDPFFDDPVFSNPDSLELPYQLRQEIQRQEQEKIS